MNAQYPILASRIVTEEIHDRFVALSGDRNPMHVDPIAARRTQAGGRVVHGVHTLLWALETLVASGQQILPPVRIKARFLQWVYPGDECILRVARNLSSSSILLKVEVREVPVLTAEVAEVASAAPSSLMETPCLIAPIAHALDLPLDEIEGRSGHAHTASAHDLQSSFPWLIGAWGAASVAEIIACSYVVGMEVPGLHSMFSRVDLNILAAPGSLPRAALHYLVRSWDRRFRKVRIAVEGRSVLGMLDALVRVPPVEQASMQTISAQVHGSEFAGMNALIIGGSRGLGEVVAKLIAAGGGTSTISYVIGRAEAERLAAEICAWGARASTLAYDAMLVAEGQLAALPAVPTHLFYFATKRITLAKRGVFCASMFAEFSSFYIQGFYDLCTYLIKAAAKEGAANRRLIVFYPSTVMVQERPPGMTEYAMAKAAGEQMCADMNEHLPGVHVIIKRLPKLLTDQTAGVLPDIELDPVATLLPVVREMQAKTQGA